MLTNHNLLIAAVGSLAVMLRRALKSRDVRRNLATPAFPVGWIGARGAWSSIR